MGDVCRCDGSDSAERQLGADAPAGITLGAQARDFGDGDNASGPRVEHAWSAPGTYQVTLFIDREDASSSRLEFIEVVP